MATAGLREHEQLLIHAVEVPRQAADGKDEPVIAGQFAQAAQPDRGWVESEGRAIRASKAGRLRRGLASIYRRPEESASGNWQGCGGLAQRARISSPLPAAGRGAGGEGSGRRDRRPLPQPPPRSGEGEEDIGLRTTRANSYCRGGGGLPSDRFGFSITGVRGLAASACSKRVGQVEANEPGRVSSQWQL